MMRRTVLLALAMLLFPVVQASADDWPQWRGPKRDGVWRESGIIEKFAGGEIKRRWSVPIAGGYCGPTVANGRVYVADRVVEPVESERVHCFDWTNGKKVWSSSWEVKYTISYTAGPRASITVEDGCAYALGSMGNLFCLDAADGTVRWKKTPEEMKVRVPIWGVAAAPLVEGDLLIVQIGGENACVMAFDKKTGQQRWAALEDPASYSAPIMIEQAGRRVLVCWTATRIVGMDPKNGALLWESPYKARRWADQIMTPAVHGNQLFVASFADGSLMLRLAGDKLAVEEVWRRQGVDEKNTDALHSLMCNPVLTGDYLYGMDSYGEFRCLNARTGDRIWENKTLASQLRWGSAHMIERGDKAWLFNDMGELIIGRLSPQGFEEISRAKLLRPTKEQLNRKDGVTWSHPAFAYKYVFNRNDEELVCASLAAEGE